MADNHERLESGFAPDLLAERCALVTGGGTGIGRATALALAGAGARVAVLGRREAPLRETAAAIEAGGGDALALPADIREPATVTAALEQIRTAWGRLDVLVNNAGGQYVADARDITVKGFEAVVRNNLVGTWCVTRLVADAFMLEHGGRIVCVTAAVRSGMGGFSHTAAARGGVVALAKSLAFEWATHGILINCVAPGTIKTDAMGQYPIPPEHWHRFNRNLLGRMGEPRDVADLIVFLASPLAGFITGEEIYVDGGETLHLAHDARDMIDAGMFTARKRADESTS